MAVILVFGASVFAQDTVLTKEETINYLQKRANELKENEIWIKGVGNEQKTLKDLKISLTSGNKIKIIIIWRINGTPYCFGEGSYAKAIIGQEEEQIINPALMLDSSKTFPTNDETITFMSIIFAPKSVQYRSRSNIQECKGTYDGGRLIESMTEWNRTEQKDTFFFPFPSVDPKNKTRIEKAFLHLRDLAKAEEDPFDN